MYVRSMVAALLFTAGIGQCVFGQDGTIPIVESVPSAVSSSDNPTVAPGRSDTADAESTASVPVSDVAASSQKP